MNLNITDPSFFETYKKKDGWLLGHRVGEGSLGVHREHGLKKDGWLLGRRVGEGSLGGHREQGLKKDG